MHAFWKFLLAIHLIDFLVTSLGTCTDTYGGLISGEAWNVKRHCFFGCGKTPLRCGKRSPDKWWREHRQYDRRNDTNTRRGEILMYSGKLTDILEGPVFGDCWERWERHSHWWPQPNFFRQETGSWQHSRVRGIRKTFLKVNYYWWALVWKVSLQRRSSSAALDLTGKKKPRRIQDLDRSIAWNNVHPTPQRGFYSVCKDYTTWDSTHHHSIIMAIYNFIARRLALIPNQLVNFPFQDVQLPIPRCSTFLPEMFNFQSQDVHTHVCMHLLNYMCCYISLFFTCDLPL